MDATSRGVRRVIDLADRVAADIRHRKLQPGDRYLSTAETAKLLRVDTATANRALQLLAKRRVISRRRRVGTFIADGGHVDGRDALHRVNLLVCDPYPQAEGWLSTDMLFSLQSTLPGVRLQFHAVPDTQPDGYVEGVINDALSSNEPEAFILLRASVGIQRMIEDSGLPAVIFGHPYASITKLPFVDRDQQAMGRLIAEFLLGRGHRRVVLMMRQRLLPGDHAFIRGVARVMTDAGRSPSDVSILCLPHDSREAAAALADAWEESDGRPGILARSAMMADAARQWLGERGLTPMKDVAMAVSDYFRPDVPPYAVIRPQTESDEQGARIGRLVAQLARGERIPVENQLAPVRLDVPERV